MSYIVPAPLIYQQLANAGGVANISPDLNAVIIGPCYNIIDFDSSSISALGLSSVGSITNNAINNTFNLPNQKPGQVVDMTSLAVYFNNASVRTAVFGASGSGGGSHGPGLCPRLGAAA